MTETVAILDGINDPTPTMTAEQIKEAEKYGRVIYLGSLWPDKDIFKTSRPKAG